MSTSFDQDHRSESHHRDYQDGCEVLEIVEQQDNEGSLSKCTVLSGTTTDGIVRVDSIHGVQQKYLRSLRRQRLYLGALTCFCFFVALILAVWVAILLQSEQKVKTTVAVLQSGDEIGNGMEDENGGVPVPQPAPPSFIPAPSPAAAEPVPCGCPTCSTAVWSSPAGTPAFFTCGDRVRWLIEEQPERFSEVSACRQVASEYPCDCGGCDPTAHCLIKDSTFELPGGWTPPADSVAEPDIHNTPLDSLACFSEEDGDRTSFTIWNGMVIHVKDSPDGETCGPGNNRFENSNVKVESDDKLVLRYAKGAASEVRILLPEANRPYTYGSYEFEVESIAVKEADGTLLNTQLPKDIVLGLHTWYGMGNRHAIDMEISAWDCDKNADVQYLIQPGSAPSLYRFFSGAEPGTRAQGGQTYRFDMLPGRIDWSSTAGGGQIFSVTTDELLYKEQPDTIPCMPDDDIDVRISLWNMWGARQPVGLKITDYVEVIISKFTFTPSNDIALSNGDLCSKDCQCETACVNNQCA